MWAGEKVRRDPTLRLARLLASPQVVVRFLPQSGHVLPLDRESAEVCRSIVSFFQGVG